MMSESIMVQSVSTVNVAVWRLTSLNSTVSQAKPHFEIVLENIGFVSPNVPVITKDMRTRFQEVNTCLMAMSSSSDSHSLKTPSDSEFAPRQ